MAGKHRVECIFAYVLCIFVPFKFYTVTRFQNTCVKKKIGCPLSPVSGRQPQNHPLHLRVYANEVTHVGWAAR